MEGDNDMARLLGWGSPFVDIIDNERVSPLLECLLNPGSEFPSPGFRLDHVYATLLRPGTQADPTLCGTSSWHSGPMMWPRSRHEFFGCDVRHLHSSCDDLPFLPVNHRRVATCPRA